MIRHIAVFRFAPEFTASEREEWMALLRTLPGQVPGVRSLTVGENLRTGGDAFDIGLVADVDDEAALEAYTAHPVHQEVLRISGPVKTALATVDLLLAEVPGGTPAGAG